MHLMMMKMNQMMKMKEHKHNFKHIISEDRCRNSSCKIMHKWLIHRCNCGLESNGIKIGEEDD